MFYLLKLRFQFPVLMRLIVLQVVWLPLRQLVCAHVLVEPPPLRSYSPMQYTRCVFQLIQRLTKIHLQQILPVIMSLRCARYFRGTALLLVLDKCLRCLALFLSSQSSALSSKPSREKPPVDAEPLEPTPQVLDLRQQCVLDLWRLTALIMCC